ncbi:MAG: LysE family transporter [Bacillota bacterium]
MEPSWIFVTAFAVAASGALVPGPLLTYTVSESITRGWSAGPLIVLGHALLEILLVISLFLGLQTLITSETVKGTIGLVGGGVLLWMGTNILRQLYNNKLDLELEEGSLSICFWKNPVVGGVVVSLSNPYFLLWWATIGFAYLIYSASYGFMGICLFVVGHLMADLVWYSAVSLVVVRGKNHLKAGIYRGILAVCGLFLVALALYFIWDGWQNLPLVSV